MGKRLILILALAFVVGIAFAAYAEVQNIKVSGDLEFDTVFRNTFSLMGKNHAYNRAYIGYGPYGDASYTTGRRADNIFLTIARVRVDADLTDNVSATVRLIGEWLWGRNDNNNLTSIYYGETDLPLSYAIDRDSTPGVDIDLAYATLKEFLYSPLTLVVGRQELHYGNDMIIGDSDTNRIDDRGNIPGDLSKRKSFDAVRAILNYDPLTVDLVYAKIKTHPYWSWWAEYFQNINNNLERVGDRIDNDTDLYGVNAKYDFGRKNTVVEGYYWYKRIGPYALGAGASPFDPIGSGTAKSDQLHTFGGRVSTKPIENLTFQLEVAGQQGRANIDADDGGAEHVLARSAWALETATTYDFKKVKYTPSLTALFAYFSGQNNTFDSPQSSKYKGWDPMFENQTFGHVANALMPQTNIKLLGINGSMKPMDDITLKAEYYHYWFIQPYSYLAGYYPTTIQYTNRNKRDAGQEVDLTLTYDYTEDVQLSLLGGVFIPGEALEETAAGVGTGNDHTASEVIGSMKVTF